MICPALLGFGRVAHAEDPVQPSGLVSSRAAWLTLRLKPAISTRLDLIRLAEANRGAETEAETEGQPATDQPDPSKSIGPEVDERRREQTQAAVARTLAEYGSRDRAQPVAGEQPAEQRMNTRDKTAWTSSAVNYIPVLRLSGIALVGVGLITALVSHAAYDASTCTKKEYETLRLWNDLGWASVALGGGAFGASFMLKPPHLRSTTSADFALPGPARVAFVQVRGTY